MKNNTIKNILFVFISLITIYACHDDDPIDNTENIDRLFMPMFRQESNTGVNTSSDPYGSKVVGINDIQLYWYGVTGASGYRIKMKIQGRDWEKPSDILMDTIVGPDVLSMKVEDLQYNTGFNFAIQALSPKGEQYNSKWYGYGDAGRNNERCEITTGTRYDVPDVLSVQEVTSNTFRIYFNLTYDPSFSEHFEGKDGKFIMDEIKIEPSYDNAELPAYSHKLTAEDLERGYIDFGEGTDHPDCKLSENAVYVINGLNNNVKRYWDRLYNTTMVRMKGEVGEPILIEHYYNPSDTFPAAETYNASRIDTILTNYMSDNTLAEGTVFLLEAGKTYYMQSTINISKGFTLKSNDPNKRATVLMGIGTRPDGAPYSCNFSFGRNANIGEMGGINVQSIIFEGIDFDAPEAYHYGNRPSGSTGLGNYFINQSSQAMPFTLSSFEVRNCTFQRMIRGWIRIQGPNRKIIEKFVVDNCLFYNSGYYDNNGRGYAWVNGDGTNKNSNIFMDISFTNNTFVDSPRQALLTEAKNLAWGSPWKITLMNNTFINFSTRSSGRYLLEMRYMPDNSDVTIMKNLFIQTKAEDDDRNMYLSGMDIRNTSGTIRFHIKDNYSTNTNLGASDIFTTQAFSHKNGAGINGGVQNEFGKDELPVKLGTIGISPTELMVDPNPIAKNGDPNMHVHKVPEGLYYKNSDAVRNHEIYKLGIGDPRWAVTVTP